MKIHSVTIEVEDGSTKTMTVDEFKRFKKAFDRLEKIANPPEEKQPDPQMEMFLQQQMLMAEHQRRMAEMQKMVNQPLYPPMITKNTGGTAGSGTANDWGYSEIKAKFGGILG